MRLTDIKSVPGHEGFVIVFVVMAICIGSAVGAKSWQARHPLPMSYARIEPAPLADLPKMSDRLPVHLVATTAYRLDPTAASTRYTPMPWTCPEIRAYAKTHTEAEMHAKAREHKLTPQQRDAAKACLEGKR